MVAQPCLFVDFQFRCPGKGNRC